MSLEAFDLLPILLMFDVIHLLPIFLIGGFFSSIIAAAAPILGALAGVPAAPVALAPAPARISAPPEAMALLQKVAPGGRPLISPEQAQQVLGASGRLRRRTTIETFDPVTGVVTRTESFSGGVAVRQSDVVAARRVFRQIAAINKRIPRKTQKVSDVKMLTDRVVKNALERAGDLPDCPK